jgi:oligogalacturonide transporter
MSSSDGPRGAGTNAGAGSNPGAGKNAGAGSNPGAGSNAGAGSNTERRVGPLNLAAYGIGDLYGGGSFLLIGMLFLFFLTEVVGLSPALAGVVFAIGKVWDAVTDPLMGYISDRTRSRFGRRRVYFLIGIVPILISFSALWAPIPAGSQAGLFIYYSLAYMLFSTVFTMVMVPYSALNAEMSKDYTVRTRLSGTRIVFSQISALLAGTVPTLIINAVGGDQGLGYLVMGIGFAAVYALVWLPVFFGTWELPQESSTAGVASPGAGSGQAGEAGSQAAGTTGATGVLDVFRQFGRIFRNRSFRIHVGMYICSYTAVDILMALFAYYITYYIGRQELYSVAMGSLLLTQILMLPVYVAVSNRWGKGRAFVIGLSVWVVGLLASLALSQSSPVIVIAAVCVVIGAGVSAGIMVPWAILPSVIDVDEYIYGVRRAGVYSGAMTLIRKAVQGVIALPLIGVVLELIGFAPGVQVPAAALTGLRIFFVIGPAVLIVLGVAVGLRFPITPKRHAILREELERRRNGGAPEDMPAETKEVCYLLSGSELGSPSQLSPAAGAGSAPTREG